MCALIQVGHLVRRDKHASVFALHCHSGRGQTLAVGNYGARISPRPRSKLNSKCSAAAAWAMLRTSGFLPMHWIDFFFFGLLPEYTDRDGTCMVVVCVCVRIYAHTLSHTQRFWFP